MKKHVLPKIVPQNRRSSIKKALPVQKSLSKPNVSTSKPGVSTPKSAALTSKPIVLTPTSDSQLEIKSNCSSKQEMKIVANGHDSPIIIVDDEKYDEINIKDLLKTNKILSQEIEELKKNLSQKDFQIRHLTREVNDLRQNYDKVKSVLNQKIHFNDIDNSNDFNKEESALRLKKQGVSGESFSPSSVEIRIYEKSESAMELIEMAIKGCQNDFLKKLEPVQIKQISQCMYEKIVKANVYIIREKEVGEHMYVLASGKLEVIKDGKKLREMYPGELFGELAILQNCLRTASVKSTCETSVWTIDRKVYQAILQKTNVQENEKHTNFLKSVNLLKNLSREELVKIVGALIPEEYRKGECIVREGEEGQTFYLIKNGQVRVDQIIKGNTGPREIRKLKAGDYFGEQALLKNEIRTASVIADSDIVELLGLDREDFIRLIGQNNELNNKDYGDEKRTFQLSFNSKSESPIKEDLKNPYGHIQLNDLEFITTLGVGAFGKVELVKYKSNPTLIFALKSLEKQYIVEMKQEEHVFSERNILLEVKSPFICKLYRTYRSNKYVYLLLEACLGGEVWTILRNKTSFDEKTTKFVLGCVILALDYLHSKGIIYRDLKPENLILDKAGYIKLCDFGFAKKIGIGRKTFTFCGTPEYVSPEVILNRGHDNSTDIWAIGVLTFELLTGSPPFHSDEPMKIYNQILKGIDKIEFPYKLNKIIKEFIKGLCRDNPTERLGYGKTGISAIMHHKFFSGFNWEALTKRKIAPPIIPKLEDNIDTKYFDSFPKQESLPNDEFSGWDKEFEY